MIALGLWFCAAAVAADSTIDVDKLKPGDKLEVQRGGKWVAATFVGRIAVGTIRVKTADFPVPMGMPLAFVRVPQGAKAGPAAGGHDNPFATPEEKLAKAAAKRTWSDTSGKFKVEATLVRIDGTNVVLRRQDGQEVSVPVTRLSADDQLYVRDAALKATAVPGRSDRKRERLGPPRIAITPTELTTAPQAAVSSSAEWTYQPPIEVAVNRLAPVRLALRMNFHERPLRMLFLPQEKKVFAVSSETLFGDGTMYRAQACDLAGRRVGSPGNFGVDIEPLAVAPDGSLVVARVNQFGHGGQSELQLYALKDDHVKPLAAWLPYGHHTSPHGRIRPGQTAPDADHPALSHDADVTWGEFLDPTHVITQSFAGELAVWRLPEIEAVYYMPADRAAGSFFLRPALSADRRHFAVPSQDGVALLQASDGEVVGILPAEMNGYHVNRMAWSDDGTRLALFQPGRVRVWDLTTRELTRDFPVDTGHLVQDCGWVDNNHLILNGTIVIDAERRIPLATIDELHPVDATIRGGIVWRLTTKGVRDPELVGTRALPAEFKDPAAGKSADDLLVIRPGIEVALELPPGTTSNGSASHAAVVAQLQRNGVRIVPQSKVRLVGTLSTGETRSVKYTTFRRDQTSTQSITEQILNLSYLVDGQVVWKYEARMGAPPIVHMNQGESIGDALARVRKMDGSDFGRVWIPAFVARVPTPKVEPAAVPGG